MGIKTSKFGKDFTPPLAPPARGGEYVGLPRTSGGEQEISHRPLAPYMKDFSRAMRKNPTQAENKLWQELRGKKLGFGFRRQFVIDSKYIADFVCLEKRLIIECDGGQHNKYELPHPKSLPQGEGLETSESLTQAEGLAHKAESKSPLQQHEGDLWVGKDTLNHPDIQRDFYLESQNFRILRFWNNEILGNLEGVLCVIKEALESNVDFANVKSTCESTHPLAPSAREGEREGGDFAREGEIEKAPPLAGGVWGGVSATMEGKRESSPHAFKFKHSGIEWLGEIPQHWEVRKLKFVAKVVLGKMLCNENKSGYTYEHYLKSKNIQWFSADITSVEKMYFSDSEKKLYKVQKNDLLVSEGGEVGKTCIWNNELTECYLQNSVHKVTFDKNHNPRYFLYLFFVYGQVGGFDSSVSRVSIAHLTWDILININFIVPPLDEQKQIAEFLDSKCAKIDKAIAEYKTSLIDKAVRGQI